MRKIKALWPDHKLILVCRQGLGDFFLQTGLVDQVFEIAKGQSETYKKTQTALRELQIDKVFSPHNSWRTAFFVRGLKAAQKVSFRQWWNGFFFAVRGPRDLSLPDAIRQLSLLSPFDKILQKQIQDFSGKGHGSTKNAQGRLTSVPEWASMSLKDFYSGQTERLQPLLQRLRLQDWNLQKTVALFPGSVWATKRWTQEGFISVGKKLSEQGKQVLVMGGPGEEELCQSVASQIPGALNICGKTKVFESGLLLSRLYAAVGNDSASMHLAATAETPSVVVFGPTVLRFGYRPWQSQVFIVEKDLPCRPCGAHGPQKCPLGTHACMKNVAASEVLESLSALTRS